MKQYDANKSESHKNFHTVVTTLFAQTRPVYSTMTEFVQRNNATNILLNNAPIERVSIHNLMNQVQSS
jgi:hypothetical protein